jgi:serine/threonine protein kinase
MNPIGPWPDSRSSGAIPDHELFRLIARGNYGEVWLARNMMGRYRAVKIVYRHSFEHDRPFERELAGLQKYEPVSRSHEGLVDVLHVGREDQGLYFYYIMELADDQVTGQQIDPASYSPKTLGTEMVALGRLPVGECLRLGLGLSAALGHLHKNGLSHRDLKPSNIIFVEGVPKLADIGLVTNIGKGQSYVGTPGFIPPEGPGTPQADIYSLGKVLYEISTGKDRLDFPELPTDFDEYADAEAFREFNEVILKACQAEARQRYQTAEELHAELTALLNGKSIKRLRLLEQRWRLS